MGSEDGKNLYWTTDINAELPIKLKPSGIGALEPRTLSSLFRETALKQGDKPALYI
jgi:hypothetical protein